MAIVQLIERVQLSSSLWLTFWRIASRRQVSLEIARPSYEYKVGQVYRLDPKAKNERQALQPIIDEDEIGDAPLLIKLVKHGRVNQAQLPEDNHTGTPRAEKVMLGTRGGRSVAKISGGAETAAVEGTLLRVA